MSKKNYINELSNIQGMLGKVRTINEAMQFNDVFEDEDIQQQDPEMDQIPQQEMPTDKPEGSEMGMEMDKMNPEEKGMKELDQMGEIDKIREITLSGMMKLCKEPQNPKYIALKKIFQMCDKGVEEETKQENQ